MDISDCDTPAIRIARVRAASATSFFKVFVPIWGLTFALLNIGELKRWNDDAMQSIKCFNASILLPALDASPLHWINFKLAINTSHFIESILGWHQMFYGSQLPDFASLAPRFKEKTLKQLSNDALICFGISKIIIL
jgi:hypothetical protein